MRLKNTLRNMLWNFIGQFALILTGLLLKRVLLHTIGTEKVGLNYLFNDIVGLLSIAELGITSIIAYYLYEPLAKGNEYQIVKLIEFFRKAYFAIGCLVILLGFGCIPFLGLFIGETTIDHSYILIAFVLFLFRNTEEYFFSYKYIVPYADQKSYMVSIIDIITNIIYSILSVFVIIYTKNYLYVLFLEIVKKIINDFIMIQIVNKKYPFLKTIKRVSLEKSEIKKIGVDIKNAFISKVSKAVIATTDNIIMSVFLGLGTAGLFSNYSMVLYTIQNMLKYLISSAEASIGNLLVMETDKVVYSVVQKMTFISFFTMSLCGCCLMQLTTPFVSLFFGKEYVLSQVVVLICILNIYIEIVQKPMVQLSETGGLFQQTKKINLLSCIINVVLSLIGVKIFGISGILLGTLISRTIEFALRIKVNFNEILKISYKDYVFKNLIYVFVFVGELGGTRLISKFIRLDNPFIEFALLGLVAAIIPVAINSLIYYSSDDFKYMMELFGMILRKKKLDHES